MPMLKVTAKGQIAFRRDLLRRLGIRPGEKISVELLPGGCVEAKAARPNGQTLPTQCELAWVLSRGCKIPADEISEDFRRLIDSANVVVNRPAAEAGLAHLEAGGDFADGVIGFEGAGLGVDSFVSFDKSAAKFTLAQGMAARLPT